MSYVFAGYPLDVKPKTPKQDIKTGTTATPEFTYAMYQDLALASENSIGLIVGASVDRGNEQSIHSSFTQLIDYVREKIGTSIQPLDPFRGYLFEIPVDGIKAEIELVGTVTGNRFLEAALDQTKLSLVYYAVDYDVAGYFSSGLYDHAAKRILELAREKNYICSPSVDAGLAPIPDIPVAVEGDTVTIAPPTWTGVFSPDWAYWMKDGVTIQPLQDGLLPLVLDNVLVFDSGAFQVKAGLKYPDGSPPDQYTTSLVGQLVVTPTDIAVEIGLGGTSKVALYGADTGGSNPYGSITPTDVAGGGDALGYTINGLITSEKQGITRLSISISANVNFVTNPTDRLEINIGGFEAALSRNPNISTEWNSDNDLLAQTLIANFDGILNLNIIGFVD